MKHEEMKELMSKEYCCKMKLTLESELNDRNIVSIKRRAVSLVRYGARII